MKLHTLLPAIVGILSVVMLGAVPSTINYQGVLTDADGNPFVGSNEIIVQLYSSDTPSGVETSLFSQSFAGVQSDSNGIYSIQIGDSNGTLQVILESYEDLWLELTINSNTLSPRHKVNAVPYALHAESANRLINAESSNISGSLSVSGTSSLSEVTVSGDTTVYGDTTMHGNVTISGNTSMNGNVTIANDLIVSGEITASSDVRLKKNIKTIPNALEKVQQLRGVEFEFTNSGKDSVGLIAQEVENVIPQVVLTTEQNNLPDMKSVNYASLVGVLVEAIKEQQLQIDDLKAQVSLLEAANNMNE